MINSLIGGLVAILAGGGLAAATVFGVVSNQTEAPSQSPVNSQEPAVDYGSTE